MGHLIILSHRHSTYTAVATITDNVYINKIPLMYFLPFFYEFILVFILYIFSSTFIITGTCVQREPNEYVVSFFCFCL